MAIDKSIYQPLWNEAEEQLKDEPGSHDIGHIERVYTLCEQIGIIEKADLSVLLPSAILHDIGRKDETESFGKICHAKKGAEMAREILPGLGYSPHLIKYISGCIETHRIITDKKPKTIEAMVLFDADKLDSIGAVGIGRDFLFAGEIGARLFNQERDVAETPAYSKEDTAYREWLVKLRFVRDRMMTSEGKRRAGERHRYMEQFFERFLLEMEGKL